MISPVSADEREMTMTIDDVDPGFRELLNLTGTDLLEQGNRFIRVGM